MNRIERVVMHALFTHLHHNADRAVDFHAIDNLNRKVSTWGSLVVGPGDDAAVFRIPYGGSTIVAKMESHCSPCVVTPYNSAHTCVDGTLRDVVAMGGRPVALLNFVGTRPLDEPVLVGPCGFKGVCECGACVTMTSKERLDLIMKGIRDACRTMDVLIVGGGFSTSFSDIVPAVVGAAIGSLVTTSPLTKPAKQIGDEILLIGETSNDGNDTLFRAGLASEMRPAVPVFEKERIAMEATLAVLQAVQCHACSDLGAAGIAAAVCESARYGGFGAQVNLANVPTTVSLSPEETLACETQGRYAIQLAEENVDLALSIARSKGATAEVIGVITADDKQIFEYDGENVAVIPNRPSKAQIEELTRRN